MPDVKSIYCVKPTQSIVICFHRLKNRSPYDVLGSFGLIVVEDFFPDRYFHFNKTVKISSYVYTLFYEFSRFKFQVLNFKFQVLYFM